MCIVDVDLLAFSFVDLLLDKFVQVDQLELIILLMLFF